jgi:hypothetical protein
MFLLLAGSDSATFGDEPTSNAVIVEPSDLAGRGDLVGREVIVDDRVRYFQFHRGEGYDEIHLKRTPVVFRIPRPLRPQNAPGNPAVQVRGVLRREGEQLVGDVSSFQLLPADTERLDQVSSQLKADDFKAREAWAGWALRRAREFDDASLKEKALRLEGDALRIQANAATGADAPAIRLKLAEEGRRRQIPEPEPSAIAHQAFRAKLSGTLSREELDPLIAAIERFFPNARRAGGDPGSGSETWRAEYEKDPANGYRAAPGAGREWLDRRLWLDAMERRMRSAAKDDPRAAIELALQAQTELPELPKLAAELGEIAINAAERSAGQLRLTEAKSIASAIRDRFQRPDRAQSLLTEWLSVQRKKLSPTDADGQLSLAGLYEELINDRRTAIELLRNAWKADPSSKEVAQAFRTRGYRKAGDDWVEDGSRGNSVADEIAQPRPSETTGAGKPTRTGLLGLDPDQVRQKLGNKPNHIAYCGSRGRVIEQWIYLEPRTIRYVNFIRTPNELKPRVISEYSLHRTLQGGQPGAFRP